MANAGAALPPDIERTLHPALARRAGIDLGHERTVNYTTGNPTKVVESQETETVVEKETPKASEVEESEEEVQLTAEEQAVVDAAAEEAAAAVAAEETQVIDGETFTVNVNGVDRVVSEKELIEGFTPADRLFKVKATVMGQEIEREVPLDELRNGYSATEFFTQTRQRLETEHTQALAETSQARERALAELQYAEEVVSAIYPGELDVDKLKAARPNDYGEIIAQNQKTRDLLDSIKAKGKTLSDEATEEQKKELEAYSRDQHQLAVLAVPEWQDPAKFTSDMSEIAEFMTTTIGLSHAELGTVRDHRMIRALHYAKMGHDILKAKGTVKGKKGTGNQRAVVLKPGGKTSTPATRTVAKNAKIKAYSEARELANRTQRTSDWARAFRLRREIGEIN